MVETEGSSEKHKLHGGAWVIDEVWRGMRKVDGGWIEISRRCMEMRDENTEDEMNHSIGSISRRLWGAALLCIFREFKSDLLEMFVCLVIS